jgi:Spy/CpxP family protein refolding chaperone
MLERMIPQRWPGLVLVAGLAMSGLATAQVPVPPPAAAVPHAPAVPGKPAEARKPAATPAQNAQQIRDKLRASIRAMRAQKLAEVLKPDAPTAVKLQEISEKYGDQLMALRDQASAAKRDLVKQLQSATPDQAAVTRLTEQLLNLGGRTNRLEEERMTAVKRVLTPVQFGRFLVAWPKINRQIQEKIYQALAKMGERRDSGGQF